MLSSETKRHIDAARDVLVGVAPNPISQIDQITYALIYKFMDDMDQLSIKAGGEPSFFVGDLEDYSWSRVTNSRLGNQEKMNLYADALSKFSLAKQLPELFRQIFKSAILPYRSPETLGLFLKEINNFDYTHPEELGNAYEYLLSIMGAQGDAGQFRTPRHIIDFVVGLVNPTKTDTILDPACGTAGFLISSYNHILNTQEPPLGVGTSSGALTPAEKIKLTNNIFGFDIDPTMVRIAQVNMYLHQFKNPNIYQYDSLTNDSRWSEKFDVVLANPPFMTPKGGITPHTKFSVKSSRAEVLFVDYIIEHLTPAGRAGIIVPEGVIGNSNATYFKKVRELILDDLWAVVSLHPWTFAPYAEVNTYVLLIDKSMASRSKSVLFVDVNDDGFDKSSQRRPIDKNDLPSVQATLADFQKYLTGNQSEPFANSHGGQFLEISKADIRANPEVFLLGKKYTKVESPDTDHELMTLGDLIIETKEKAKDLGLPVWSVSNRQGFVRSDEYFDKQIASLDISNYKVVRPRTFAFNPSRINVGSIACNFGKDSGVVSPMYTLFKVKDESVISPEFLLVYLKSDVCKKQINQKIQGATRKVLKKDDLFTLQIPVPSLKEQSQLLEKLKIELKSISELESQVETHKSNMELIIRSIWN